MTFSRVNNLHFLAASCRNYNRYGTSRAIRNCPLISQVALWGMGNYSGGRGENLKIESREAERRRPEGRGSGRKCPVAFEEESPGK